MSWFPNMEVPHKFKAPNFEKYNGTDDPMIHLQMYCRKMTRYVGNELLLIQTFQDTLTSQVAFFIDLIPIGERIEDAVKSKKIVDTSALLALAEQAAQKTPVKKNEGEHDGPPPRDFDPNATCEFHFGAVGHSLKNCKVLKHRVQDLLDHGILKFDGVPNIKTNPLSNHPEGGVSAILVEEDNRIDLSTIQVPWKKLFYAMKSCLKEYFPIPEKNEASIVSIVEPQPASEVHRKALVKVLNEAYVPEDNTAPCFENMVTAVLATNQLTFLDDELPPEGRGHVKALHITVKIRERIIAKASNMIIRPFDGTLREVFGKIDLSVEIGPQAYNINFQVLRVDSPYNMLMGRPWLHTAGVVPSSFHQKMKFIIGNQLVTILAEEPISIYNDPTIPYIDGNVALEVLFHSFEFVLVIHKVATVKPEMPKAIMAVAWEFIRLGFQPGLGLGSSNQGILALIAIKENKDGYGLGYIPTRKDRQQAFKIRRLKTLARIKGRKMPEKNIVIPHIRTTFLAPAMGIHLDEIVKLEDEEEEELILS
uniref:G-patch domain-containing protein n=1 Tax=Fagus sylvatica TaxID=28930 RepID=A0A2N9GTH9_FAGSY